MSVAEMSLAKTSVTETYVAERSYILYGNWWNLTISIFNPLLLTTAYFDYNKICMTLDSRLYISEKWQMLIYL